MELSKAPAPPVLLHLQRRRDQDDAVTTTTAGLHLPSAIGSFRYLGLCARVACTWHSPCSRTCTTPPSPALALTLGSCCASPHPAATCTLLRHRLPRLSVAVSLSPSPCLPLFPHLAPLRPRGSHVSRRVCCTGIVVSSSPLVGRGYGVASSSCGGGRMWLGAGQQ